MMYELCRLNNRRIYVCLNASKERRRRGKERKETRRETKRRKKKGENICVEGRKYHTDQVDYWYYCSIKNEHLYIYISELMS